MSRRLGDAPKTERQRSRQRDKAEPWREWYKTARWQKLRLKILKRDGWQCQQTQVLLVPGKTKPNSAVVDHIKPHRGDPKLFWDENNLQSVSKHYHDTNKQSLEKSGLA